MSASTSQAPAYYAIIPANVRYCKDLEPNAKLLYGEITALCNQEGFCWASNRYFAELYQVDIRTIKRWIFSLSEHKFIFIHTQKNGFHTQRRICISEEVQKILTKGQKCHGGGTKMSPIILHKNTTTSKVLIGKQKEPPPKDPDPEKKKPEIIKPSPAGGNKNVIHKCLEIATDLSPKQKTQISHHEEPIVAQAVRYAYHHKTKLTGGPLGRFKSILHFCKHPADYKHTMDTIDDDEKPDNTNPKKTDKRSQAMIGRFTKGQTYSNAKDDQFECIADSIGFGFLHTSGHVYSINWKTRDFDYEWKKLLEKIGLEP